MLKIQCPHCQIIFMTESKEFHPFDTCSFACAKAWKEAHDIKIWPMGMKMIHQKGRGKNHCQWIATTKKSTYFRK